MTVREIDDDELEAQLKKHEVWLKSVEDESDEAIEQRLRPFMVDYDWANRPGANLQSTKLTGKKFSAADLRWANFRRAGLQNADFRRANLRGTLFFNAEFQNADLRDADLARADLSGADLKKAMLFGANLREANLQDADLTDVKGLLAEQLAGSNVSGAKLPRDIAEFKGLDHIEQISKIARPVYLTMLLGCLYAFATIASTTDTALVTNSASQILPNLQTAIPTAGFYWAAPILLFSLYLYLHLYLQGLWEGLAGLPAIITDGRPLDQRAYPWLITSLVRKFVPLLTNERRPFASLKAGISIFVAWGLVPLTLFAFWLRYLPRHDWVGTSLHIGLAVATILAATVFYSFAARTLRGDERPPFHWRKCWRDGRSYQTVGIVFAGIVFSVLSYGAIDGVRTSDLKLTDVRTWVPRAFEWSGYSTFANLRQADVSAKPANWSGKTEDIGLIKGADLQGKDLRYANGVEAFLVKANFRGADLHEFNLKNADLRGADLRDTNVLEAVDINQANLQKAILRFAELQGADFLDANLQGADLFRANLQGANLGRTNLQGANLGRTNLQGSNLFRANLQGTKLRYAKLQGADLRGANLQGADLSNAEDLTKEQLDEACGNSETKLPEHLEGYKMKPCEEESR